MSKWKIKTRRGKLDLVDVGAVWARFARYTKNHRFALLGALLASFAAAAMQLAAPWPIKIIFDHVLSDQMADSRLARLLDAVSGSVPGTTLAWVCGAILLIAILDALFAHTRDVTLAKMGQSVVGKIRRDLFAHLQTLPPSVFERRRTGDLLMRLTGDVQMLRQMLITAVIAMCQSLVTIVLMVAGMIWIHPWLAALGMAAIPVTLWAGWRISRQIRVATDSQREKEGAMASIAHDVLGAMAVVQAFNREPIEHKRFARQERSTIRAGVRTTRLESKLDRVVAVASAAALCAIVYVGVRAVLNGSMTAGDLLVFVAYLRGVNKPLRQMSKVAGQLAKSTTCGQRIAEIFALEPSVRDRPSAVPLGSVDGEISFERVSFGYDGRTPALSDVSFSIEPGQRVAIVGHTGAGKSTLAKLLLRFYDPQRGTIRVDGVDIRDVALESLRRQIGWVHQDTVLFGMTVAENIALGDPDAEAEAIRAVARRVGAEEFIETLPKGYDTVLGQHGNTLSGGQRQRLALARALLRQPRILMLDEPVVGLDAISRSLVEQAWMSPANRATTMIICHRLHQMDRFDRILVLRSGVLFESGTHAELLAKGGEYAAMVEAAGDQEPLRWEPRQLAC
jgi:ABC-type multidrug transport system fused ATPase/permease subunit